MNLLIFCPLSGIVEYWMAFLSCSINSISCNIICSFYYSVYQSIRACVQMHFVLM